MCDSRRTWWLSEETGPQESKQPSYVLYPAGAFSTTGATPNFLSGSSAAGSAISSTHTLVSIFSSSDFIVSLGCVCCVTSDSSFFYLLVSLSCARGQTLSCPCVYWKLHRLCSNTRSSHHLSFWSSFFCLHAFPGPPTISISFRLVIHNLCANNMPLRTPFSLLMQVDQANTVFPS